MTHKEPDWKIPVLPSEYLDASGIVRIGAGGPEPIRLPKDIALPRPVIPEGERPLQHDAVGYGDGLQGVPRRGAALPRSAPGLLRDRAGDHRESDEAEAPRIRGADLVLRAHVYDEGKKITWRDGLVAVRVLVTERFRP